MVLRSSNAKTTAHDDGEDDLQALARQTLPDVPAALPPEPFAIGFDIASLASSSRPSRPPSEQTDGRIDLAAARAESRPAPRASGIVPRAVPASITAAPAVVSASAPSAALAQSRTAALDRDLDDLIAARAFSPAARVTALVAAGMSSLLKLPLWSWALVAGVGIGIAAGGVFSSESSVATLPDSSPSHSIPTPGPTLEAPAPRAVANGVAWRPYAPGPTDHTAPQGAARSGSPRVAARTRGEPARGDEGVEEPVRAEGGERSIDELLDRALSPGASAGRATGAEQSGASGVASLPSRDQVARVLGALQPSVRACAGDRTGLATAQIVARSDGRIVSVRISGAPFSRTSMGRCMERAIRGASFPPFSRSSFRVSYPFQI